MKRTAAAIACSILAGCGKVASPALPPDAGPSQPTVEDVDPAPGAIAASARFTVRFSAAMDEGQLLAPSGRSETVALAAEADVERAAAAIEHAPLSAHERTLLIPAEAAVASDRRSISLAPDSPLLPGGYYLLVSPRLKDEQGRRLAGNGARFEFHVAPPPPAARLLTPAAGGEVPWNVAVVRAFAERGRIALLGPHGEELVSAEAHGPVALPLVAPLFAGGTASTPARWSSSGDASPAPRAATSSCAPWPPPGGASTVS